MSELMAVTRSALLFRRQRVALPQTFIFFVTSRCNARCDFCLYFAQIENPVAKSRELRPNEVERIAERYGPLHYLALSGGEPFVRDDVGELVRPFLERCGTAVVDIPSNFWFGARMVEAVAPLARRHPGVVFDLQLSLDHVGHAHDESRRVDGLYAQAVKSFRALAEVRRESSNVKLKINIVHLERNARDLTTIMARIRDDFDADRIQLTYPHHVLPPTGSADPSEAARVQEFEQRAEEVSNSLPPRSLVDLHTLGVRSVKHLYHRLLREAVSGARPTGAYCEAGRNVVVLDEKGDVFPCEPLWEAVGNVRDHGYDVGRVLRGQRYERFREERLGACSCTWSCAMNTHVSVSPELLPALGVEAGRIALRSLLRKARRG